MKYTIEQVDPIVEVEYYPEYIEGNEKIVDGFLLVKREKDTFTKNPELSEEEYIKNQKYGAYYRYSPIFEEMQYQIYVYNTKYPEWLLKLLKALKNEIEINNEQLF